MANLPTITAVSAPRIRKLADKRAPVPAAEREERRQANAETQRQIDDAISEWRTATFAKADELADRFHKTPRYFLDQFFNGGAHMLQQQNKTNAFNAFKSIKAAAVNDGKTDQCYSPTTA
jgi:hypothetical protein